MPTSAVHGNPLGLFGTPALFANLRLLSAALAKVDGCACFPVPLAALKYMFLFKDLEEVEASKKSRTTGNAAQVSAPAWMSGRK
jgi:hypothetical protein